MRTHHTASTSIDAYHALGPKLGRQQRTILAHLATHCHRDWTRSEIADATGERLSSVCGRVRELLALQVIVEGVRRPCRMTNESAHPLQLSPSQMELACATDGHGIPRDPIEQALFGQ